MEVVSPKELMAARKLHASMLKAQPCIDKASIDFVKLNTPQSTRFKRTANQVLQRPSDPSTTLNVTQAVVRNVTRCQLPDLPDRDELKELHPSLPVLDHCRPIIRGNGTPNLSANGFVTPSRTSEKLSIKLPTNFDLVQQGSSEPSQQGAKLATADASFHTFPRYHGNEHTFEYSAHKRNDIIALGVWPEESAPYTQPTRQYIKRANDIRDDKGNWDATTTRPPDIVADLESGNGQSKEQIRAEGCDTLDELDRQILNLNYYTPSRVQKRWGTVSFHASPVISHQSSYYPPDGGDSQSPVPLPEMRQRRCQYGVKHDMYKSRIPELVGRRSSGRDRQSSRGVCTTSRGKTPPYGAAQKLRKKVPRRLPVSALVTTTDKVVPTAMEEESDGEQPAELSQDPIINPESDHAGNKDRYRQHPTSKVKRKLPQIRRRAFHEVDPSLFRIPESKPVIAPALSCEQLGAPWRDGFVGNEARPTGRAINIAKPRRHAGVVHAVTLQMNTLIIVSERHTGDRSPKYKEQQRKRKSVKKVRIQDSEATILSNVPGNHDQDLLAIGEGTTIAVVKNAETLRQEMSSMAAIPNEVATLISSAVVAPEPQAAQLRGIASNTLKRDLSRDYSHAPEHVSTHQSNYPPQTPHTPSVDGPTTTQKRLEGIISPSLSRRSSNPIDFRTPRMSRAELEVVQQLTMVSVRKRVSTKREHSDVYSSEEDVNSSESNASAEASEDEQTSYSGFEDEDDLVEMSPTHSGQDTRSDYITCQVEEAEWTVQRPISSGIVMKVDEQIFDSPERPDSLTNQRRSTYRREGGKIPRAKRTQSLVLGPPRNKFHRPSTVSPYIAEHHDQSTA